MTRETQADVMPREITDIEAIGIMQLEELESDNE